MKKDLEKFCELRIPGDPERKVFSPNEVVAMFQKYQNYSRYLLGFPHFSELRKRDLFVLPKELILILMENYDSETFKALKEIMGGDPIPTSQ